MGKHYFFAALFLFFFHSLMAQEVSRTWQFGFNYGQGTQEKFPVYSDDYHYQTTFYKLQLNYLYREGRKWNFELLCEPSLYKAEHQLINKHFVQPSRGKDYLAQRVEFTQPKSFHEYVLNFGALFRYRPAKPMSLYLLGSVGPMYSSRDTERLAKGIAFSDIGALGISFHLGRLMLDSRLSLRHVSNARLQRPNNGHNSASLEAGMSFRL